MYICWDICSNLSFVRTSIQKRSMKCNDRALAKHTEILSPVLGKKKKKAREGGGFREGGREREGLRLLHLSSHTELRFKPRISDLNDYVILMRFQFFF